jgi:hypothetical protein
MGYHLEFNCLLSVPGESFDFAAMQTGQSYQIVKEKERLYPLNIAIEICDENYQYHGKIAVRKLSLEAGKTTLEIEVLKVFSPEEAAVYSDNFIKPSQI